MRARFGLAAALLATALVACGGADQSGSPRPAETVVAAVVTAAPPTETPVPPTATPVPPTATAAPPSPTPQPPTAAAKPTAAAQGGTPAAVADLQPGWTSQRAEGAALSVGLPPGWRVVPLGPDSVRALVELTGGDDERTRRLLGMSRADFAASSTKLVAADFNSDNRGARATFVHVGVWPIPGGGEQPLEVYADGAQRAIEEDAKYAKPVARRRLTLPAGDAFEFRYRSAAEPGKSAAAPLVAITQYLVVQQKNVYALTATTSADQETERAPQFEAVGRSLRIGGPPGPAPPPAGKLIFQDNFDDARAGKLPHSSQRPADYEMTYDRGQYVIRHLRAGSPRYVVVVTPGGYANAAIAIDARLVDSFEARLLVLGCRRQNGQNPSDYRFAVNAASGTFQLARWDDGKARPPATWQPSAAIRRGGETNRLELSCAGTTIVGIVNGATVGTLDDGTYRDGSFTFGIAALTDDANAHARFDNLVIYEKS